MMRRLKEIVSLAITPLCIAFLLCSPESFAQHDENEQHGGAAAAHGEHGVPVVNWTDFGYKGKNIEGGEWKEGEHKKPPPFSLQLLNFLVFAGLMYKFFGPSITKMTRERHEAIARALSEGTRLRDEARAKLDEVERKVASMKGEIDELVRNIRAEAESESRRIIAEAEARAVRMKRDAELQIQAEMQRVRDLLEREAGEAAVSIAERLLKEKTTEADQQKLAERFVKGLSDAAARRHLGA